MINIISFIRANKNVHADALLSVIQTYDKKIITNSIHLALVDLFRRHYQGLTNKRLYELFNYINRKFRQLPSSSNVEINLSKIRQIVKGKFGYDSEQYRKSQTHLVFDIEQKKKNIAAYNEKVFQRNSNCKGIKTSLVNELLQLKNSVRYIERIVYLLTNSGCRYHEIFTGVWDVDPDNEGNVLLSNISKTRDKNRVISKPLLKKDPTEFLSILNEIKTLNENSTHSMVNAYLKKNYGESTYFLRKIYANFAYHILPDKERISKNAYLSKILGHEVNNLSTSNCYMEYFIED